MSSSIQVPAKKKLLALVPGSNKNRLNIIHFLLLLLPYSVIVLPATLIWHHLLYRFKSPIVQEIGRPAFADFLVRIARYVLSRATVAESRLLFNRTRAYTHVAAISGLKSWVSRVEHINETSGRWIAPPGTNRSNDDLVFFYIHGGGFVLDTGGNGLYFLIQLAKEMNLKRKIKFSIFCIDYELAPEFKYPSQLIEISAGYHYLVNTLKISEGRISLGGDSAGANLAVAFLLHLARPHPKMVVPSHFGPLPQRPGSALLISPYINLVSHNPSRISNAEFDFIENGSAYSAALDYIGCTRTSTFVTSWNPLQYFKYPTPVDPIPTDLVKAGGVKDFKVAEEGEGLELFNCPYVNPSVCRDLLWWEEAMPGGGATMITSGAKEILYDDIINWTNVLEEAGVEPISVVKPLGVHDWLIFDSIFPGLFKTKSTGPDRQKDYCIEVVADFFAAGNEERIKEQQQQDEEEEEEKEKSE